MPRRRAMKVCSTSGCPELIPAGVGRCDGCDRAADRGRGTAHERGYDARWRATRDRYLIEYPLCEYEHCLLVAVDVDHLDGLGPLGPRGHDWSNLQALCKPHHRQRTARDQPGGWNTGPAQRRPA